MSKLPTTERLTAIRAKDAPLVRAAGGVVTARPRAKRGERYRAPSRIVSAVEVCRQVAHRSGKRVHDVLLDLRKHGLIDVVGELAETGELDPMQATTRLAQVLRLPVVMGPIRTCPDGRIEILRGKNQWEPATDELLNSLDAETRLGAVKSPAHLAAEIILDWRKQTTNPERKK